jgi:hypothetical protein
MQPKIKSGFPAETTDGARATWWPFLLEKTKMAFVSFKKIGNKILGADIVELYHCEKCRFKIRYIIGYIKMANFQSFKFCAVHHTQIHAFVIFSETKIQ